MIARAQTAPKALPGKVAVIGFSRGGWRGAHVCRTHGGSRCRPLSPTTR